MNLRRATWPILLATLLLSATPADGRTLPQGKEGGPAALRDLADAAERGAIDPALAKRLDAGKPVQAFAILEGSDVAAAYGDGSKRGVAAAEAKLAAIRESVLSDVQVEVVESYAIVPEMLVRIDDPAQAIALLNSPLVRSITADNQNQHWLAESLPLIRQPQVNAGRLRGDGAAVAVLDTGLNFKQFAFGPCASPGTPSTANGTCRVSKAFDAAPDDGSLDADPNQHGTNVAGIVAGVAPDAKLIGIDVFDGSAAFDHDIVAGLDWVLVHRASDHIRAVNMSLGQAKSWSTGLCNGGPFDRNPFVLAFTLLRSAGVVPVVAAGNDAFYNGSFQDGIASPACAGAFSVGAVYDAGPVSMSWGSPADPSVSCSDMNAPADSLTCFSQDGPQLGVLAPGALITAAGITLGGTSQAAPHVAGAAAILAAARPYSTEQELEGFLRTSETAITDPRTHRSHPRLDLVSAVRAAFPVPNDDQAAATPLTAWSGHYEQTTWTATKEAGEPMHAGNPGGASVWFRWTASRSGTATFTTQGSDYDTLLAVYRPGSNVALAAADDDPGATTSTVQVPVTANDVLLIAVDGRAITSSIAASGHLRLTVNPASVNDDIAGATAIEPGAPQTSTNTGATHQPGEPPHCDDTYASKSVWYRWTPSVATTATVGATGSFLLCVAVYQAPAGATPGVAAVAPVAYASDDQGHPAQVTFTASPGQTYWIALDGVSYETSCNWSTGQCSYDTRDGVFTLSLSTP